MLSFMVGWGIFWLLTCLVVMVLGLTGPKHEGMIGFGFLGVIFSAIWLVATAIGAMF